MVKLRKFFVVLIFASMLSLVSGVEASAQYIPFYPAASNSCGDSWRASLTWEGVISWSLYYSDITFTGGDGINTPTAYETFYYYGYWSSGEDVFDQFGILTCTISYW